MKTRPLEGVIPVVVTPFDSAGSVDELALERLIEFLVEKSIGGMWVLGTGSEDMNLTYKKRLLVARTVSRVNAGRKPLILGAGFFCMEDSLSFMEDTADLQVDAYHAMPYHPLYSLDRLAWHYEKLADAAPKPLWLYTSANWCRHVPPAAVLALKDHPNVAGIKFSSSNATDCSKIIEARSEDFQVVTAVATQFLSCLAWGTGGHTSSIASALPEPMIAIYDAYTDGRLDEARSLQFAFNRFLGSLPRSLGADNFLKSAEEKYILNLRGICEKYTSDYYRDANDEECASIRKSLADFGFSFSGKA